jgi:hypothetical protein
MYEIPAGEQLTMIVKDIVSHRSHFSLKRKLLMTVADEFGMPMVLDELLKQIQDTQQVFDRPAFDPTYGTHEIRR